MTAFYIIGSCISAKTLNLVFVKFMLKKISTIIVIIVVAMLTSVQTTEYMKDKGKEAISLHSYTEKELEKVSTNSI